MTTFRGRLWGFAIAAALIPLQTSGENLRGTVSGVILTADGGPVSNAVVTAFGRNSTVRLTLQSDDRGRFTFLGLPDGYYYLRATKLGFAPSGYGSAWPGDLGTPIAINPQQPIATVTLTMKNGASVTGMIIDSVGEPVPGARVVLFRVDSTSEIKAVLDSQALNADENGGFRFFGLEAGEYVLGSVRPEASGGRNRPLLVGAPVDARDSLVDVPTFFPGTNVPSEADVIHLDAGMPLQNLRLPLSMQRTQELSGTISNAAEATHVRVSLQNQDSIVQIVSPRSASSELRGGVFSFSRVAPGRYRILAAANRSGEASSALLWSSLDVDVQGASAGGLTMRLERVGQISARISYDSAQLPSSLSSLPRVGLILADDGSRNRPTTLMTSSADRTLVCNEVYPGTYFVSSVPSGSGSWWLRSAMIGNIDALDVPVTIAAASKVQAVVTFSDRPSELAGRLLSQVGTPVFDGFAVVVFPADRSLWREGARRVRILRPATDGSFSATQLPSGSYQIAVMNPAMDVSGRALRSTLDALASQALHVDIAGANRTVQDLMIRR